MRFGILGPIEVRDDAGVLVLGGPKPRAVLAVLLLHANEPVSSERLAIALWGEEVAGAAVDNVRVHMSRLRKALGDPDVVTTTAGGYRLRVGPGDLDADVFDGLVEDGHDALARSEPQRAASLLREGLALWRGRPLADFADEPFAAGEVARLEEQRLLALEARVAADLGCGRHDTVAPELRRLVAEHPTRERFAAQLMLTLYRCGRQTQALDVYTRARTTLQTTLGVEPGPELQRLQHAILNHDAALDAQALPATAPSQPPSSGRRQEAVVCPFKGLSSFDVADAPYFYGRSELVRRLVDRVGATRLLAVVGPSGSGKSSLVRAGLIPALAGNALPGSRRWAHVLIRPGSHPMAELEKALGGDRRVVAVDQFEEIFTTCADEGERTAFVEALVAAAVDGAKRCTVVLVVRADFYGRCAAYPHLAEMLSAGTFLVGPMTRDELREAVEGPARLAGLQLDAGLAEMLVRDVEGEPGGLPLLSAALLALWQRRSGRRLELAGYERMGGVRGAVARLAEEAFGQLSGHREELARDLIMRLVGEIEPGRVERRRLLLAELEASRDQDVGSILALLADRRILTIGAGMVELAHEALLREWPRLRGWIEDDAEGLRIHRNLHAAAHEWARLGGEEGALYRGARLAGASEWEAGHPHRPNRLERDFLAASRAREQRDVVAARRRTQRLRALAVGLAGLAAATVVLALLAVGQRDDARRQRASATEREREATGLALAASSASALPRRPDVALLLALEANRVSPSAEARGSAIAALDDAIDPGVVAILHGHTSPVDAVAFGANGRIIASGARDGTIRLWDARTHRLLGAPLTAHGDRIWSMAISLDSRLLASASIDGTTRLWNLRTRRQVGPPLRHRAGTAASVAFGPDSRTVAVGADQIRVWNTRTRERAGRSIPVPGAALRLAFSPDGRVMATAGRDRTVRFWSPRTRRLLGTPIRTRSLAMSMAFDHAGRTLTVGFANGTIGMWDARTHKPRGGPFQAHAGPVGGLAFSPRERVLASGGRDGTIRVWDARTRARIGPSLSGHTGAIASVAFGPDGRSIASASEDQTVRIWDRSARDRLGGRLESPGETIFRIALSPDGRRVAATGEHEVHLWDVASRREVALTAPRGTRSEPLAFGPDGRTLHWVGARGSLESWDLRTRSRLGSWTFPSSAIRALSADGSTLASAGFGGAIRAFDISTRRQLGPPLDVGDPSVGLVTLSDDGGTIATTGVSDAIRFWDVRAGRHAGPPLPADTAHINAMSLSPDGRILALTDGTDVELWDIRAHEQLGPPLAGHVDFASDVAFSPDGRTLATLDGRSDIRLWDMRTHRQLGPTLRDSTGYMVALTFGRDGRSLAAAGENEVRLWERLLWRDVAELRDEVCRLVGASLSLTEWRQRVAGIPYRRSCP